MIGKRRCDYVEYDYDAASGIVTPSYSSILTGSNPDISSWSGTANARLEVFVAHLDSSGPPGGIEGSLSLAAGNAFFDNFEVSGDIALVPEPSSLLLIGVGLTSLSMRRRRVAIKLHNVLN